MPSPVLFYMDDTGARHLDREPTAFDPQKPNHFALGGILMLEEDEGAVRTAHNNLCTEWDITYPLHSVDIRHGTKNFSWVRRGTAEYADFMNDLTQMLISVPITTLACVVDRPGYDRRYRLIYPRSMWHLCQTVFSVAIERAVKYARSLNRPLRVYVEESTKKDEKRIKGYYRALISDGMPFDAGRSERYAPLSAAEFNETLIELRFKKKSSPPMQLADLCLWPVAMFRYGRGTISYERLSDAGKLIETLLPPEQHAFRGTKYSCFELVDAAAAATRAVVGGDAAAVGGSPDARRAEAGAGAGAGGEAGTAAGWDGDGA
jgi:hypothetical protein